MSRRAWCIKRCPPRSREAFESNPSAQLKSNPQFLSHDHVMETGRARNAHGCNPHEPSDFKEGEKRPEKRFKSPNGIRTKAARPFGCKARKVRLTFAGVGSLPVATRRSRRQNLAPGHRRKFDAAKSSTMKGATSPCQSVTAETEPNWKNPTWKGKGEASVFCPPKSDRQSVCKRSHRKCDLQAGPGH